MIHISGQKTYSSQGKFLITTVIFDRATLLYCVYAMLDPFAELLPLPEKADSLDEISMTHSQYLAKIAALRQLGHDLEARAVGVRVLEVMPETPAADILEPGDLIVKIDQEMVESAHQLVEQLQKKESPFQLVLKRQQQDITVEGRTYTKDSRRLLGVRIRTEYQLPELPIDIEIESGRVSGASAGLVFALEIVNRLTPEDITSSRKIAATGTISPNGKIGPVEGADLKVVAAQRAGAEVFICPKESLPEVKAQNLDIEVFGVESLKETLEVLAKH